MEKKVNFEWLSEELIQYAKKQETLLRRAIDVFIKSAALLKDEFNSGNDYELAFNFTRDSRFQKAPRLPKETGEGYLLRTDAFQTLNKIQEANTHFFNRIVFKYEESNGSLKTYKEFSVSDQYDEEPLSSLEVFNWIDDQLNGNALKERFSKYIHQDEVSMAKEVIQVKPRKGNEIFEPYVTPLYYSEGHSKVEAEPLIDAVVHFEQHMTAAKEQELADCIQKWENGVSKDELKAKWTLPNFEKVKFLKFYANGRIDIGFANAEQTTTFYENYFINKDA